MIFYHFTPPANVILIAMEGLKPAARGDNAFLTDGEPVVWLTTKPSNLLTPDDVAFVRMSRISAEVGQHAYGGAARLKVHLELNNKRLKRFFDFVNPQIISRMLPCARDWFVYFGTIPPHRIDTSLSAVLMLECLDHHIATHSDPSARERFKAEREKVVALPPDKILDFANP